MKISWFTVMCYFVFFLYLCRYLSFLLDPPFTFEMTVTSLEMPVDIFKATRNAFEVCANGRKCF